MIILDEPELGLHPFAIDVVAGLLKSAATRTQVFLATQSMTLIDIELVRSFDSPELIDDGYETAPSRRIAAHIPEYAMRKSSAGPLIAGRIGLPTLRARCPHFNGWVTQLEGLAGV